MSPRWHFFWPAPASGGLEVSIIAIGLCWAAFPVFRLARRISDLFNVHFRWISFSECIFANCKIQIVHLELRVHFNFLNVID